MSLIHDLLLFIGSPFTEKQKEEDKNFSNNEKIKLFELSTKNKVGLFFLQKLKDENQLSPLEKHYRRDLSRYKETKITAINLSSRIAEITKDFAIFKFVKPYPHTPSDVDVLFFSHKKEYLETVNKLLNNGYAKVGSCPSQIVVYDLRGGYKQMDTRVVGGKGGGKYYIDLYNNVSASHIIYIDKETLSDCKTHTEFSEGLMQTLSPEADIPVVLAHSIIPEQLFTLGDYYTTLHYCRSLNKSGLDRVAQIFRENNITIAGISSLNLVCIIHREIHGFIPDKITYLMEKIGRDPKGNTNLLFDNFSLPYRYSISTLIKVLGERMTNENGLKSMLFQTASMCDPKLMRWVLYNIFFRRTRKTY